MAHHERATVRVGDVFLKIDADQNRTDVEVEAMAMAPVPTPEVPFVWPVVPGGYNPALPTGARADLELIDEHRFSSGVVHLRYRPPETTYGIAPSRTAPECRLAVGQRVSPSGKLGSSPPLLRPESDVQRRG